MNQALYAHMNNKRKMKKKRKTMSHKSFSFFYSSDRWRIQKGPT
jgi:hypothetical protein